MPIIHVFGYLAALCTTAAFFPQAIKIFRDSRDPETAAHATDGISLPTFVVFATGVLCWLIYGLGVRDWPIVTANAVTLVPTVGIVWLTVRSRGRGAPPRGD